nr:DoxX family protein [uncultured Dyadobacter sp.]
MKRNKIIFWLATGFIFVFEGLMPLSTLLFASQYFNAGTKPLGYPDYFAYTLIIFKVLGATALVTPKLHPKIKEWAYAGLAFNLMFAVISHAVVDANISYIATPLVVGVILALSYLYNMKVNTHADLSTANIRTTTARP